MDSFKDVLEAAQLYCKGQMAEPTYNLYIDGLEMFLWILSRTY